MTTDPKWASPFCIVYLDGRRLDGVQFPSGRCVVDDRALGIRTAAISIEELPQTGDPEAKIIWEFPKHLEEVIAREPDAILSERDRLIYERGRVVGLKEAGFWRDKADS